MVENYCTTFLPFTLPILSAILRLHPDSSQPTQSDPATEKQLEKAWGDFQ